MMNYSNVPQNGWLLEALSQKASLKNYDSMMHILQNLQIGKIKLYVVYSYVYVWLNYISEKIKKITAII